MLCAPSRLVFRGALAKSGPGDRLKGEPAADASEKAREAPKKEPTVGEQLAALKEDVRAKQSAKRIAKAINMVGREEEVKDAVLNYDLAKDAEPIASDKQDIIDAIKKAIAEGKLKAKDIIFYGGTDGTPFLLRKVLAKKEAWHDSKALAFDQLIGLGERLYPKSARDLRDSKIDMIREYIAARGRNAKNAVVKKYRDDFLPGGGLFDLALALQRAKHAQKDFTKGTVEFNSLEQEVYLELGNIEYEETQRKSGVWAGEVAEVPKPVPPPEPEPQPEPTPEPPPPEKLPEPPPPEPKKDEPPPPPKKPPEQIDTYPEIVADLDLRQIMENARHSPGEKAWVYFGGPLREKMPAAPKAYIIYDKEKDSFRYGFDNVPGALEYREIVAPPESMAKEDADTWGRGGRWGYRRRIDSVEQKAFKVKLSHFIAEEMKRQGLDPKVVKVEVVGPQTEAEKASVKAASEYASERARLDGEMEKLNHELRELGVDAADLDISTIKRTAKSNPGAAATIYLRGELGKKMPLTMKAFVTYNSAEGVFEYRFDTSGKEVPDETDVGASTAQKEADLAGMKFLVKLAKKILGK